MLDIKIGLELPDWESALSARAQFAIGFPLLLIAAASAAVANSEWHTVRWHFVDEWDVDESLRPMRCLYAIALVALGISYRLHPRRFVSRSLAICSAACAFFLAVIIFYPRPEPRFDADGTNVLRAIQGLPLEEVRPSLLYWARQPETLLGLSLVWALCSVTWIQLRSARRLAAHPVPGMALHRRWLR